MKFASKASVVAAAVLFFATIASAATNVVGSWNGKIELNGSAGQGQLPPEAMAMIKKLVIKLKINANKTFTVDATGPDGKNNRAEGTWTLKGNTLSLTTTKDNGKPASASDKTQTLTVAKDGKSMTMVPPGMPGKIVFKR